MKKKMHLAALILLLASCSYWGDRGVVTEYISINTGEMAFTGKFWEYYESPTVYLFCQLDSSEVDFVLISMDTRNYNDYDYYRGNPSRHRNDYQSKPNVQVYRLLDVEKAYEQIDLLNATSGFQFKKEVQPAVYGGYVYWLTYGSSGTYALISKYGEPKIVRDVFFIANSFRYAQIDAYNISVWLTYYGSKEFIITAR